MCMCVCLRPVLSAMSLSVCFTERAAASAGACLADLRQLCYLKVSCWFAHGCVERAVHVSACARVEGTGRPCVRRDAVFLTLPLVLVPPLPLRWPPPHRAAAVGGLRKGEYMC